MAGEIHLHLCPEHGDFWRCPIELSLQECVWGWVHPCPEWGCRFDPLDSGRWDACVLCVFPQHQYPEDYLTPDQAINWLFSAVRTPRELGWVS